MPCPQLVQNPRQNRADGPKGPWILRWQLQKSERAGQKETAPGKRRARCAGVKKGLALAQLEHVKHVEQAAFLRGQKARRMQAALGITGTAEIGRAHV